MNKLVIIGNGGSLNDHLSRGDFELLRKNKDTIDTMSMNFIHWLARDTHWRPTYWIWVEGFYYNSPNVNDLEEAFYRDIQDWFMDGNETTLIVHKKHKPLVVAPAFEAHHNPFFMHEDRCRWIIRCEGVRGHAGQAEEGREIPDWHLPVPCLFGGTMNTALQVAFMLGYEDVAVIGCDLGIVEPDKDRDYNHFHPQYFTSIEYTHKWELVDPTLIEVHKLALRHYIEADRSIVNAGIGGNLEVYPRIDLRDWINSE